MDNTLAKRENEEWRLIRGAEDANHENLNTAANDCLTEHLLPVFPGYTASMLQWLRN